VINSSNGKGRKRKEKEGMNEREGGKEWVECR
jgi:hypothetical protein